MQTSFREVLQQHFISEEAKNSSSTKSVENGQLWDNSPAHLAFLLGTIDPSQWKKLKSDQPQTRSVFYKKIQAYQQPKKSNSNNQKDTVIAAKTSASSASPQAASAEVRPFFRMKDLYPQGRGALLVHSLNLRQQKALEDFQKVFPFFPKDFTRSDLKAGFRCLAKIQHPDRGGSGESFQLLQENYRILLEIAHPI